MKFLKSLPICVLVLLSTSGENKANELMDIFLTTDLIPYFFRVAMNVLTSDEISLNCTRSLKDIATGISDKKAWAIKMLDAMGKLPSGILEGSFLFPGSYAECLKIVTDDSVRTPFQGQFCNFALSFNQPKSNASDIADLDLLDSGGAFNEKNTPRNMKLQWSSCFPSTCTTLDIVNAVNIVTDSMGIPINFSAESCEIKSELKLDSAQIVSITIFGILALLILIGTMVDVSLIFVKKLKPDCEEIKKGIIVNVILAFSIYTNAERILNTKSSPGTLGAINGIKFLTMSWIFLAHTFVLFKHDLLGNAFQALGFTKELPFQVIVSADVSVDVFFFLSGLLVTYISLNLMKKRGNLNWASFILHRVWRLTPSLALVILFSFLMPLFGSGLFWKRGWEHLSNNCETYWWTSLLYFNNFVPNTFSLQCMVHGWYLANDMQFYVLSPFILYMLWRWPIGGLILNTLFLIVTTVVPALLVMAYDYVPTLLPTTDKISFEMHMMDIYLKPYCRMGPYCIGIYVGYLLTSKKIPKINHMMQAVCWCLAIASSTAVVFGTYQWINDHPSPKEINALYLGTHRTAFTLGIAWMTYACCTGYGGIINRILSWKAFTPLGRMTYMAYLIHPYVIYSLNWMFQERIMLSHYYMVIMNCGFLVIGYLLAFLTSIAFEAPFFNLEKILRTKESEEKQPEIKINENVQIQNVESQWSKAGQEHINMAFIIEKTRL